MSTAPTTTGTTAPGTCASCGTNSVGKRSCCVLGGSWFGNCGDAGDSNFDHTWFEGIQACKRTFSHRHSHHIASTTCVNFVFFRIPICPQLQPLLALLALVPRECVPAAAPTVSGNAVAAFWEALGSVIAVMPATRTLITHGSRASKPADVRSQSQAESSYREHNSCQLCVFLFRMPVCPQHQPLLALLALLPRARVPAAAPTVSGNAVAAFWEALGSVIAVMPATRTLITHGSRASKPADVRSQSQAESSYREHNICQLCAFVPDARMSPTYVHSHR